MAKYNPNSAWGSRKKEKDLLTPVGAAMTPPGRSKSQEETQAVSLDAPETQAQTKSPSPTRPAPADPYFKKVPLEKFDEAPPPKSRGWVWFVAVFVVFAGTGTLYFFLARQPAGPNVGIEFTRPDQVLAGAPFPFGVTVSNYSSNVLKNVAVSIVLPDNVSFVGQPSGQRVTEETVGDIGPGSVNRIADADGPNPTKLIVTGDPNSVKRVAVKLAYGTDAAPRTQFETDGGVDILVGSPAITLNIAAPATIVSGQNFDMTINYNNNTSQSFNNVELSLQYPPVYSFSSATMQPDSSGNNSWNLGTIAPQGSGSIVVTGNVVGPAGAGYTMIGALTGSVNGNTYALSGQSANLAIGTPPLAVNISLNSAQDYVARLSDSLNYTVTFANNSNITFHALAVKAALVGSMFDFSTLTSNGVFSSLNNTVTWNAANTPQLLNLAPGQSGSVNFTVKTKTAYPIRLLSDKNYDLKVTAQISSPTVPPNTAASSTVSAIAFASKVGGETMLAAKGYWRDAASGILNAGPYPPRVNQATQYTIHWIITNYSTDIQNVNISAYLQSGTTCTGAIKSNISAAPVCDPATGEVTWQIPNVPATAGIVAPAPEAVIQVVNTPAINQVGQEVTLMNQTTLAATDVYTNTSINLTAQPVTTALPDDKTIGSNVSRAVVQ